MRTNVSVLRNLLQVLIEDLLVHMKFEHFEVPKTNPNDPSLFHRSNYFDNSLFFSKLVFKLIDLNIEKMLRFLSILLTTSEQVLRFDDHQEL